MRLKLYRASCVTEAMACVRAELGPDALILATRRVAGGIELTAALEPEEVAAAVPCVRPGDTGRVADLLWHGIPPTLAETLAEGDLAASLGRALSFGVLPLSPDDPPLLLVGPPGAGKTLTTARLATRLVLQGISPLVITADGQRAGATEQLAAFTRLLGIDLIVASHPAILGRVLTRRNTATPVLIDGPGTDAFDPAQRELLSALRVTAGAETALVLPAALDAGESVDLAESFAEAGAGYMVATRLDMARRCGGIVTAAWRARLVLTEAGVSPAAADGLTTLTPRLLAERLARVPTSSRPAAS